MRTADPFDRARTVNGAEYRGFTDQNGLLLRLADELGRSFLLARNIIFVLIFIVTFFLVLILIRFFTTAASAIFIAEFTLAIEIVGIIICVFAVILILTVLIRALGIAGLGNSPGEKTAVGILATAHALRRARIDAAGG
ncbi:hypothetical protein C4552_00900 [Candidatus Parcubacteria bacterium]|nr:MAG: hypothetical protein C4552_00900 [Candidatus Parcubacteria bacterium]